MQLLELLVTLIKIITGHEDLKKVLDGKMRTRNTKIIPYIAVQYTHGHSLKNPPGLAERIARSARRIAKKES